VLARACARGGNSLDLSALILSRFHAFTPSRFHAFTLSRFHAFTLSRFHYLAHLRTRTHARTFPRFHTQTHVRTNAQCAHMHISMLMDAAPANVSSGSKLSIAEDALGLDWVLVEKLLSWGEPMHELTPVYPADAQGAPGVCRTHTLAHTCTHALTHACTYRERERARARTRTRTRSRTRTNQHSTRTCTCTRTRTRTCTRTLTRTWTRTLTRTWTRTPGHGSGSLHGNLYVVNVHFL
jgi:hypothetical protein